MEVPYEAARERVVEGDDAEQVAHLAFEAARREGEMGQGGHLGPGGVEADVEFDAGVGRAREEQVHHVRSAVVVVRGDQREPMAFVQQLLRPLR